MKSCTDGDQAAKMTISCSDETDETDEKQAHKYCEYNSCEFTKPHNYSQQRLMEGQRQKNCPTLFIKSLTWFKDSHSLFDYESDKNSALMFAFPITCKSVTVYRKRQSSTVVAFQDSEAPKVDLEQYQFLTRFEIKHNASTNKMKLEFDSGKVPKLKKINSQRLNTDESISSYCNKEEETYVIVRKIKDINNQQKGYKLIPGHTIKLGRVEFFVSEVKENGQVIYANKTNFNNCNRNVLKYTPKLENQKTENPCKICLEEVETADNFLFNPCACSGSCGTVHIDCLMQWIHFKVKKEVIGGTLHFNFNKFQCEVCKHELPMIVDVNGKSKELLPIDKPQGNYIILEGACEKTKSIMMIQNVPVGGIKLGRGHECEIRITDISVSRNHALIKNVGSGFYVFDNKSKFGTLVKEESTNLEIGRLPRGVQIGRTTLSFEIRKENSREVRTEHAIRPRVE